MAEIVPVTSETLEAQIRDLLPSQRGFGEDLQASNVITPIIDLTAAAEGTTTPISMQQALAFGSNTSYSVTNTTSTLTSTTGFFRVVGVSTIEQAVNALSNSINITDGLSTKSIWSHGVVGSASADSFSSTSFDIIVFLRAGDSLTATSGGSATTIDGSYRQIADVNGNLINPSGFTPQ